MYVQLCWRTKDTQEGKMHVSKNLTVKQAMELYKDREPQIIEAYLRRRDTYHWRKYRTLKEKK